MMQNRGRAVYIGLCVIGILLGLLFIALGGAHENREPLAEGQEEQGGIVSEPRVAGMLEGLEDVDNVCVMLQTDEGGRVMGVAVICENGEDPVIQEKITRLLRALYGIGAHQISVSG